MFYIGIFIFSCSYNNILWRKQNPAILIVLQKTSFIHETEFGIKSEKARILDNGNILYNRICMIIICFYLKIVYILINCCYNNIKVRPQNTKTKEVFFMKISRKLLLRKICASALALTLSAGGMLTSMGGIIPGNTGAFSVYAAEPTAVTELVYKVNNDGTVRITGYVGTATELVIPDTIIERTVTVIDIQYVKNTITKISIPSGVTSIKELPRSITEINVASGNQVYSSQNGVVFNKQKTSLLIYPKSKTGAYTIPDSTKTIASYAFFSCSISSITFSRSVTCIEDWAFSGCKNLTAVNIPNSVNTIGDYAFSNCTGLKSFTIPSSVTSVETGVISGCTGLKSVGIPASVTSIGEYAFANCTGLTGITIPNSVASVGNYAFNNCTGLTSITIPDSVTSFGTNVFKACSNLAAISVGANNPAYSSSSGALLNKDQTLMICFPEGKKGTYAIPSSAKGIADYAFYNCKGLTGITIPKGLNSIGKNAFAYCYGLQSISLPEGLITVKDYAFFCCNTLTGITVPKGVTSIGEYAFASCSALKNVSLPVGLTSIEKNTFYSCSALTGINIPEGVTSIKPYAFTQCTSLASITIPDSVTEIGDFAFAYTSPTSIILPDGISSIRPGMFSGCEGLVHITIPDSVTAIEDHAFYGCESLTGITLPDHLTLIGSQAFCDCINLNSITIPASVTSIDEYAFENCDNLTIHGEAGSSAYTYAKDSTIPFVDDDLPLTLTYEDNSDGTLTITGYTGNRTYLMIPDTINQKAVTVLDFDYDTDYTVTKINIPGSVLEIRHLPDNNLAEINVDSGNQEYSSRKGVLFNKQKTSLVCFPKKMTGAYTVPTGVKNICASAFYECSISSVVIPSGITQILPYTFAYGSLTSVTIPGSVESIGNDAFYACPLTNVVIPYGVKTIGDRAFSYCTSLTDVSIPGSVTSIGEAAFACGQQLTCVTIPASVTNIGSVAFGYVHTNDHSYCDVQLEDHTCYNKLTDFVIHGIGGTAVQIYAQKKGFEFIDDNRLTLNYEVYDDSADGNNIFTIQASAQGGSGSYQYAFFYKMVTEKTWISIQNFGANNTVQISPAFRMDYDICIKAKDSNGTIVKEYTTVTSAYSDESIASVPAAAVPGTDFTFRIKNRTGIFEVYYNYRNSGWVKVNNSSYSSDIKINLLKFGTYYICVKMQNENTGHWTKYYYRVERINTLVNESTISSDSIYLGGKATVNCAASGGYEGCHYSYEVYYKAVDDNTWTTISTKNGSCTIQPTAKGNYTVCVKAFTGGSGDGVTKKYFTLTVKEPVRNTTVVPSSIVWGSVLSFTITEEDGSGNPTSGSLYDVYYKLESGSQWFHARPATTDPYTRISLQYHSTYDICIKIIKDDGSITKSYYKVQTINTLVNESVISSNTVYQGNPVRITFGVSGGPEYTPDPTYDYFIYHVHYKKADDTEWTYVDYRNGGSYDLTIDQPGQYVISVDVWSYQGEACYVRKSKHFSLEVI